MLLVNLPDLRQNTVKGDESYAIRWHSVNFEQS